MEAARALLAEHGLRRTSLADIARAADVSAATLYRRFPTRNDLLGQLVVREARAFIARVDERVSGMGDPEEQVVTGFLVLARALREHDLIHRLLQTDPETVLPLLTTQGAPIISLARDYMVSLAGRATRSGARLTAEPEQVAELFARIAHSLVLTPESALPLDDERKLEALARATLARLAVGSSPSRPEEKP